MLSSGFANVVMASPVLLQHVSQANGYGACVVGGKSQGGAPAQSESGAPVQSGGAARAGTGTEAGAPRLAVQRLPTYTQWFIGNSVF